MTDSFELLWALPLTPFAGYVWLYCALRCFGRLSVGAEGWHAAGVDVGGRVLWPALRMFAFFQPLLRLESGLARRVAGRRPTHREQAVPDVVVELIPIA